MVTVSKIEKKWIGIWELTTSENLDDFYHGKKPIPPRFEGYVNVQNAYDLRQADFRYSGAEDLIIKFLKMNYQESKSILSIGCGSGDDIRGLSDQYKTAELYGLDVSREALILAKQKTPHANFICASMANLPFKSGLTFDTIVAGDVLHIFSQNRQKLRKILELITQHSISGSRFYLTFNNERRNPEDFDSLDVFPVLHNMKDYNWRIIHQEDYDAYEVSGIDIPHSKSRFIVCEKK